MLFDVIVRLLAAIGLTLITNAKGITTTSVVVSICIFLFMEVSLLFKNKYIYICLTAIPFLYTEIALAKWSESASPSKYLMMWAVVILAGLTGVALVLYSRMTHYQEMLNKTKDDSRELENVLENKNRRLMMEQDQQVHLATLAERNRIAREIHDNVGHLLSRAILLLGAITTVNKDEKLEPQLKMLADTLDESMAKMRSSVHDLHDDSIDLKKNFEEIIGELKNFTVNTDLDLDEAIPTNIKLSLIGILKEAVTNILKHSNGDTVSIIVQQNYSFCTLSITDNGAVSEETKRKLQTDDYEGIGLNNISNRARSIGGDAYFYTDEGFTVYARLPFGGKN